MKPRLTETVKFDPRSGWHATGRGHRCDVPALDPGARSLTVGRQKPVQHSGIARREVTIHVAGRHPSVKHGTQIAWFRADSGRSALQQQSRLRRPTRAQMDSSVHPGESSALRSTCPAGLRSGAVVASKENCTSGPPQRYSGFPVPGKPSVRWLGVEVSDADRSNGGQRSFVLHFWYGFC
jgi:hypothetical protein